MFSALWFPLNILEGPFNKSGKDQSQGSKVAADAFV